MRILRSLGIEPITYTRLGYSALSKDRVENGRCHNKVTWVKLRQQIICGNWKWKADDIKGVEGKLYCPGIAKWVFHCWKMYVLSFRILLFWCFKLFGIYLSLSICVCIYIYIYIYIYKYIYIHILLLVKKHTRYTL